MPLALPWPLEEYRAISLELALGKTRAFWEGGFMWNPPGPAGDKLFETDDVHREKWARIDDGTLPQDVDDGEGTEYTLNAGQWDDFKTAYVEHTRDAIQALYIAVTAIRAAPDTATMDTAIAAIPDPN